MGNRNKPVDFDELYPGRFIKAGTLKGKRVTLTIAGVDIDELEGDKGRQIKGIVSFAGKDMQWVLNKTNGLCLREMFGRKVQDWVGKRVTLHPEIFNGDDCIRVYGSPDIEADREVEIRLPKKRPQRRTLHAVRTNGGPPPKQPEREPGEDNYDHETGEVA